MHRLCCCCCFWSSCEIYLNIKTRKEISFEYLGHRYNCVTRNEFGFLCWNFLFNLAQLLSEKKPSVTSTIIFLFYNEKMIFKFYTFNSHYLKDFFYVFFFSPPIFFSSTSSSSGFFILIFFFIFSFHFYLFLLLLFRL